MSGFDPGAPDGYRLLADVLAETDRETLGRDLAAGRRIARGEDHRGKLYGIPAFSWRGPEGTEMMDSGLLPDYGSGERCRVVIKDLPAKRRPPAAKATDSTLAGRPVWWPSADIEASEWVSSAVATAEAERRVRAVGPISEGLVCTALETMWGEAGRNTAEGSFARLRRRARQT